MSETSKTAKLKTYCNLIDVPSAMTIIFIAGILMTTQGYCDGVDANLADIESATSKYTNFIFNPVIRKAVFTLGFGWGAIASFMKSSFIPFITYAGLGAIYNLTPSIVKAISSL